MCLRQIKSCKPWQWTLDVATQCDDSCTSAVETRQPPVIKFSTAANGRFYVRPALYCTQPPPPPLSYAIADQFAHPPLPLPRYYVGAAWFDVWGPPPMPCCVVASKFSYPPPPPTHNRPTRGKTLGSGAVFGTLHPVHYGSVAAAVAGTAAVPSGPSPLVWHGLSRVSRYHTPAVTVRICSQSVLSTATCSHYYWSPPSPLTQCRYAAGCS